MLYTCIVVDDDFFAVQQLEEYVETMPTLKLKSSYTNAQEAIAELNLLEEPIDFLFTDIEMPEVSGFDLAKQTLGNYKYLILVSSHIEYGADCFDVNASQFLTKPFSFKKFEEKINSLIHKVPKEKTTITVKKKTLSKKLALDDIVSVESYGNYVLVYTLYDHYSVYISLTQMMEELGVSPNFIRISRFCIISINHIAQIEGKTIRLKNGQNVKAGKTYGEVFKVVLTSLTPHF